MYFTWIGRYNKLGTSVKNGPMRFAILALLRKAVMGKDNAIVESV